MSKGVKLRLTMLACFSIVIAVLPINLFKAAGMVELVAALVASLLFVIRFHVTTGGRWKKSDMGRHVMALVFIVLVVLVLSFLRNVFGDYASRERLVLFAFGIFAGLLVERWYLLEREQRAGKRRSKHAKKDPRNDDDTVDISPGTHDKVVE